jgi:PH domain
VQWFERPSGWLSISQDFAKKYYRERGFHFIDVLSGLWERKYWFLLHLESAKLQFYSDEKEIVPLGSVDIRTIHRIEMPAKTRAHSFELISKDGGRCALSASSPEDRVLWIRALDFLVSEIEKGNIDPSHTRGGENVDHNDEGGVDGEGNQRGISKDKSAARRSSTPSPSPSANAAEMTERIEAINQSIQWSGKLKVKKDPEDADNKTAIFESCYVVIASGRETLFLSLLALMPMRIRTLISLTSS